MKKLFLFATAALISASSFAQRDYNKWSIEGGVGVNKPYRNMTPGYYTDDANFFTGDIGVRYMWSQYLGAKVDYGYNSFSENDNSAAFESTYSRVDLQLVANAGKVLNFQEWTKTIGLLVHGGGGVGFLGSDLIDGTDGNVNLLAGATLQFRLAKRLALNLDGTAIAPIAKVDRTYDAVSPVNHKGLIFNGTVGLSVYLGGHEKHADWYLKDQEDLSDMLEKYNELAAKIEEVRNDAAKVADLAAAQDGLKKVASDVEALKNQKQTADYNEFVKQLSAQGFVSAFFSYDSSKVNAASISNINFLKTYLENNPSATVEIQGYADEMGAANYNQKLSERRAEAAAKLLVEAGIAQSRITTVGKGVDASVDKNSSNARQLARRASFVIK
ncbi:MAG: OmpA family protein [Mangrovibacterium sp.]